ncbi:YceD family protein [Roseovarius amoyensis]|uniref:YceD family protein n=1 Tax=Roseovarius amoyensis TaxID=2211448 RepID=UPI000DBE180D|nr:DUF177 domain-containing protein [Roseovarius amoyensis]
MQDEMRKSAKWRVGGLSSTVSHPFDLRPGPAACDAIARDLGLRGLRKLRLAGTLAPDGRDDWRLDARLGATVTQDCVVTLAPATTRIDEDITRRFLRDWPPAAEQGEEAEMPDDDSIDPLGTEIDLWAVMTEALALALPPYPRAEGVEPQRISAAPPDAAPDDEERPNPFAALETLRGKLDKSDE